MQIIVTTFLDKAYRLLTRGSSLARLYEDHDTSFVDHLKAWLADNERLLEENRRPQVGEIAGIRARLASYSNGVYDKSFSFHTNGGGRKVFNAAAALLFHEALAILQEQYGRFEARREEGSKFIRQIMMISLQKNTFYPIWNSGKTLSEKLNHLWQSFSSDPDLVQGTRQVLSAVSYADALRIMEEVIEEWRL